MVSPWSTWTVPGGAPSATASRMIRARRLARYESRASRWVPPSRNSAAAPSAARASSRLRPRPSSLRSRLPSPSTRMSVEPSVMVKITFLVELVAGDDGGDQAVAKLVRIEQYDIDVQDGKSHKAPG